MWATSMGSTFAHRPVPGVRKSGIPEGTEMPAPVRATTDVAARTRSASAWRCSAAWTSAPDGAAAALVAPSAANELRRPLAEEGANALAGVLGGEGGGEGLLLEC